MGHAALSPQRRANVHQPESLAARGFSFWFCFSPSRESRLPSKLHTSDVGR